MTTDAAVGGESTARPEVEQERWYLNDQREFLLRSIDDAEREHAAGDLSEADYDVLMVRDQQRLAEVEGELSALGPATQLEPEVVSPPALDAPTRAPMALWRKVGIVATCLLIVAGAGILVNHAVNPSLPGQAPSGSITESKVQLIARELAEAVILNNNREAIQALQVYDKVLSQDPTDPEALAASGWLEWNYGNAGKSPTLISAGRRAEKKAIAVAPFYYAGHLFLGLILLNQDHNTTGAITQFTKFLADSPPKAEVVSVATLVAAGYKRAKLPYPSKLASALATEEASSPTTSPTTTTTPSTPSTP